MKPTFLLFLAAGLLPATAVVRGQTLPASEEAPATVPATQPAEKDPHKPLELPDGPEGVVAQVGQTKILVQDLATILDKIPYTLSKKKRKEIWTSNLENLIYAELLHSYLEFVRAPDAPDELAELKKYLAEEVEKYNQTASLRLLPPITVFEMMEQRGLNEQRLADQARYRKLYDTITSNEELLAFLNKHPEYFDGTTVHVGHILLKCSPTAPTAEQKRLVEKLRRLAAEIQSGKRTFSQAAREHSQCPSGQKKGPEESAEYGDLGERTFIQLAGLYGAALASAAFEAEPGLLHDVIRSPQGFHLVKVYRRTKGNQPPGAESAGIARFAVSSLLENQILRQALDQAPIVIYKASRKVPRAVKK